MNGKNIMWKYIREEISVLDRMLDRTDIPEVGKQIGTGVEAVYFVCHGSSYNAAVTTIDFIARHTGIRAYALTPAAFLYAGSSVYLESKASTLIVAISQTGTSRGCIEALRKAKSLGFRVVGVTDVLDSPVARESDLLLHLDCGEENSNAKTKGYSATLLLSILVTLEIGRAKGAVTKESYDSIRSELRVTVNSIPHLSTSVVQWCVNHQIGRSIDHVYILGTGMNFGSAMEGQLKLMETLCIPTMFNDMEEFSHGMHRSIHSNSTIILLKTDYALADLTELTFQYLRQKTPYAFLLDASSQQKEGSGRLNLPRFPYTQSVFPIVLAIQIISAFAPETLGNDPNRDANNDYTDFVKTRI